MVLLWQRGDLCWLPMAHHFLTAVLGALLGFWVALQTIGFGPVERNKDFFWDPVMA